jgi:hypothetical protein
LTQVRNRGDPAISSLPNWAEWVIVVACPLFVRVIALLVIVAVEVWNRWITGAKEAPVLVPVAAREIGRLFPSLAVPEIAQS